MKCDLILNETLQGGVQPDYAAQWAQYYRSQVVFFDNLGHILCRFFFTGPPLKWLSATPLGNSDTKNFFVGIYYVICHLKLLGADQ